MNTLQQRQHMRQSGVLIMLLCLSFAASALAFQLSPRLHPQSPFLGNLSCRMAAIDPNDLANTISSIHQHHHSADASVCEAILSTLYSTTSTQTAHGHSNPLFGPPDPYLAAGKSIAPTVKASITDGVEAAKASAAALPEAAKEAVKKPFILDSSNFQAGSLHRGGTLPGFKPTGGIFAKQQVSLSHSSVPIMEDKLGNAKTMLTILQNAILPTFLYVLADFFFIRRDEDLYQEDIEQDPVDVTVETVQNTGKRLGVFVALALVTAIFFSG